MNARSELHTTRSKKPDDKRGSLLKPIISSLIVLAAAIAIYLLGSISGERTLQFFYNHDVLLRITDRITPPNLVIHYKGQLITDKAIEVKLAQYSGGSMSYTSSPDSEINLNLTGDQIDFFGFYGKDNGIAAIYIDHVFQKKVDLYSPKTLSKQLIYQSNKLTAASHSLTIRATGETTSPLGRVVIGIDNFVIHHGEETKNLEDDNEFIQYYHGNHQYYIQFIARKLVHVMLYLLITFTLAILMLWNKISRKRLPFVLIGSLGIAVLDEYNQSFATDRFSSLFDIGVDMLGAVLAVLIIYIFFSVRKYRGRHNY